jgi:hypothetical protein
MLFARQRDLLLFALARGRMLVELARPLAFAEALEDLAIMRRVWAIHRAVVALQADAHAG